MLKLEVKGAADIEKVLNEITPRHATNLIRATVGGVAGEVRDAAKLGAPKKEGILRKAIKVKREKMRGTRVAANVIVDRNKSKSDAFYWRFLEYGTSKLSERPFFMPALRQVEPRLPNILRVQFVKKLEAALKRQRKKLGGS